MSTSRLLAILALMAVSFAAHGQGYVDGGDAEAGKGKASTCVACHGANGNSNNPEWPNLAGQHAKYLLNQLQYFKAKERPNPVMWGQAANLSEQDMKDLAAYYEGLEPEVNAANEEVADLGESIFRGGLPAKGVPACAACHGPAGTGNPGVPYPRLAGQKATYTANALTAYRSGERSGYGQASVMNDIASKLSDEEIQAVSSFVSGLYVGEDE